MLIKKVILLFLTPLIRFLYLIIYKYLLFYNKDILSIEIRKEKSFFISILLKNEYNEEIIHNNAYLLNIIFKIIPFISINNIYTESEKELLKKIRDLKLVTTKEYLYRMSYLRNWSYEKFKFFRPQGYLEETKLLLKTVENEISNADIEVKNIWLKIVKKSKIFSQNRYSAKYVRPIWFRRLNLTEKIFIIVLFFLVISSNIYLLTILRTSFSLFLSLYIFISTMGIFILLLKTILVWQVVDLKRKKSVPNKKIDLFITTYNEPVDIIKLTIQKCLEVRYPHKTIVLDDGNRKEIKLLTEELKVNYISRTEHSYAKAGNINNALKYSTSEFFCVFDADGLPTPNFIDALIGYFEDTDVSIVQSHQSFYNLNGFHYYSNHTQKHFWNEQSYFYDIVMPAKNSHNSAIWGGNGAILRRSHIDEIGGISTESVTEDYDTSLLLQEKGHKIIYYPEPICFAMAPVDYKSFITQRLRWQTGALQIIFKRFKFFSSKKMPLMAKICHIANYLYNTEAILYALFYFLPLILFFDRKNLKLTWLSLFVLIIGQMSLGLIHRIVSLGRANKVERYNYLKAWPYVYNFIAYFFIKNKKFVVTPKVFKQSSRTIFDYIFVLFLILNFSLLIFYYHKVLIHPTVVNIFSVHFLSRSFIMLFESALLIFKYLPVQNSIYFYTQRPLLITHLNHIKISDNLWTLTEMLSTKRIWFLSSAKISNKTILKLELTLPESTICFDGKVDYIQVQYKKWFSKTFLYHLDITYISDTNKEILKKFLQNEALRERKHLPIKNDISFFFKE